ncbi:hypothetical protein DUI87_01403 [Hirundo rustica rustica]|uniref:ribonuclease H n=1 Tax=Hirundo rustica rustica TaxID=333673 RepID=A0A3M0L4J7_HIRRU|nr:hypothetical protein DUI87_01403 [Hirundo rustica rustica]
MDSISQVIHDRELCATIKQAKQVKPIWYGGQWSKYKYGEAWQIDYITLPQTCQGLQNQVLWRHGTPERIESDNGTHFKNSLINTWAREHDIEWVYHIPYHAPASGKVERYNGLLKTTLSAHWTVIEVDLPEKSRDLTVDHTGLNSEYFVIGDTAHTPMETEIAPMTIKGNMPKLILLAYCPQPPFYLAKGQIITQAIPTPAGVPVDDKTPDVYWAEVVGEDKPIMGCNLTRGRDHLHVEGLLDTRSHVTVIPEKMWPSHWDLQPVAGKLQDYSLEVLNVILTPHLPDQRKKKSKSKSVRIVTDEDVAGPSHPAEETEPEIITRSLSLGELRDLQREFTRQTNESILTWLLRIWDTAANATILDGSEARQLGLLSRDGVIDQGIGRTQQTLSLWQRLLTSVRDRYLCKEDLQVEERDNRIYWTVWIRWPGTSDPQKYTALVDTGAQCTLMPSRYVGTESISISGVTGGSQQLTVLEAEVSLTGNGWQKHPIVTGPEAPCILGIDYLRNGYFKDPKGYRWAFGIAAVETEDIRQLNTLPGLSDDSSAVGLLRVEEQVPIATSTVHHRQYRTDRDSVIPIHEMIRKLESQGVVSKARSPFNSPIWPVRKSSGEWRLMVDYRALNEVTPPLSAAVPDMLELQYELESKAVKWYATIDIANAFFSIPLAAECRAQFAFTWKGVQYTWNRLPQGWKHSPTICHGLIQAALEKGEAPEHLQYIDDIIVWGNTAGEVFEKGEIIQIVLKAGFAIKRSKVKGPAQEIQFPGVKWQDGCCQIPTEVINKITAISPPTNKKETQAFLGAIGFWRMHIPEYSQIVSPLYLVTRKKNDFHWGPEQQQAFAQIKQEIAHAVALGPVRMGPKVKNVLYSAAGNNGLSWSLGRRCLGRLGADHWDSEAKATEYLKPTTLPQRRKSWLPMKEFKLPRR